MDKLSTKSTSLVTASVSEITLREKATVRLVFRPTLVENPHNPAAGLSGVFLYQRKGKNDEWEDFETIPISSVKKGEGYKLDLSTEETLTLFNELVALYAFRESEGIPRGNKEFVRLDAQLKQLLDMPEDQLQVMLTANSEQGAEFVTRLFKWALSEQHPEALIKRLSETAPDSLRLLNTSANVERMRQAIEIWSREKENPDEKFWQKLISEHSYVLEQVFSWPLTIVEREAYVGGTRYDRKGGRLLDFLVANQLTNNAALVEVKTPTTSLLKGNEEYRSGVYNVSDELSGAVMQVLNYKQSLLTEYRSLGAAELFEAFDPKCVVVIGHSSRELANSTIKKKSFELYRNQLSSVSVVTYDELVAKTANLIKVLEAVA